MKNETLLHLDNISEQLVAANIGGRNDLQTAIDMVYAAILCLQPDKEEDCAAYASFLRNLSDTIKQALAESRLLEILVRRFAGQQGDFRREDLQDVADRLGKMWGNPKLVRSLKPSRK